MKTNKPLSPSFVVCQATGITDPVAYINRIGALIKNKPSFSESKTDGHCRMCGEGITKGDMVSTEKLPSSFIDHLYMFDPSSSIECPNCAMVRIKEFMDITTPGYIFSLKEGAYAFCSNVNLRYFLLNPLEGPKVAFKKDTTSQHLAWKAAVSYDKNVTWYRYGNNNYMIRHDVVNEAYHLCTMYQNQLIQPVGKNKKQEQIISSYLFNSTGKGKGALPNGQKLVIHSSIPQPQRHFLQNELTPGDEFALLKLLDERKESEAVKPEPLTADSFYQRLFDKK